MSGKKRRGSKESSEDNTAGASTTNTSTTDVDKPDEVIALGGDSASESERASTEAEASSSGTAVTDSVDSTNTEPADTDAVNEATQQGSAAAVSSTHNTTPQESIQPPEQKAHTAHTDTTVTSSSNTSTSSASTPASAATKKTSSLVGVISLILSLLTLLLLVIAGYFGWQQWQQWQQSLAAQEQTFSGLNEKIERQQASLSSLKGQQQSVQQSGESTVTLVETLKNDQQLLQRRLQSHANRLQSLSGTSRNDWLLAEARYLLRLANQRLLMERATDGAQALLESADQILVAIDDVDLFRVRDAIASDIVALKLAPTIDREGLYLRLSAMSKQLDQIPAIPRTRGLAVEEVDAAPLAADEAAEPVKWYWVMFNSIKDSLKILDKYVQVTRLDEPPQPMLSADQQSYMIHNLRLLFEQAQLALLREQQTIYQDSLQQAQDWINTYYTHYENKATFIKEIDTLQQLPVKQNLPDISGSLKQLTAYIERYHKLTPDQSSAEPSASEPATKGSE